MRLWPQKLTVIVRGCILRDNCKKDDIRKLRISEECRYLNIIKSNNNSDPIVDLVLVEESEINVNLTFTK